MATPWHEDESFWRHMAIALFGKERWESAPEEIENLVNLIDLAPGSRVLDLPCGPGRHALEFARRGYTVTGVDITQAYLDEAGRRADSESLPLELIREDMRRFSRTDEFDLVVNLFSSFGYFHDPKDDERIATNFLDALKPGGMLVMEMMGREIIARGFKSRDWTQLDDGGYLLEERTIREQWGRIDMRWIYIREGLQREYSLDLHSFTATELIELLTRVGFEAAQAYGNLDGDPYDHNAERLVVTARKPA